MNILVVDDNQDAASSLSMFVGLLGHQPRTACDGEHAVKLCDSFLPDLVLMDLQMPRMDGFEACRRIRALPGGRYVTIVALTGLDSDEDRRRTRAASFDDHLGKPCDPERLLQLISGLDKRVLQ